MGIPKNGVNLPCLICRLLMVLMLVETATALGQTTTPARDAGAELSAPGQDRDLAAASEFAGRIVEGVRILGNTQVSTAVILQLVRTREGDKFDPSTVVGDYQRIYDKMKTFMNVEARVQPTKTGVIVVFIVTEQQQIHEIRFVGNIAVKTDELKSTVDLKKGEAIDMFRINLAQQAIERFYQDKNFSYAHADFSQDDLRQTGDLIFRIVEGPKVRIRKIDYIGNDSFSTYQLGGNVHSKSYIFIFDPGKYDPEQVDEDVAALSKYYHDKGFFEARVGRKITRSTDMKEIQLTFVIDEGPRYYIDEVLFEGNTTLPEGALLKQIKLKQGLAWDQEVIDQDVTAIVKAYSASGGFIYDRQPGIAPSPEYLQINPEHYFEPQRAKVRLVYRISEGKKFRLERILIRGNANTQDKVILRELRMRPGQQYDSSAVLDAADRLRGLPQFQTVTLSPVGDDPDGRDLLVEVTEQRTAKINAGVGINSDGGLAGQLSYEQQNFDVGNVPNSFGELFSSRAFTGAGQDFMASLEPGTEGTDATISFTEPYLFDQPYSFGSSIYYDTRIREVYNDQRLGGSVSLGKRFNYIYSISGSLRGEDVVIKDVEYPYNIRAPEIVAGMGHHTLSSASLTLARDTTNHGPVTYEGTDTTVTFEDVGALGGTVDYDRVAVNFVGYRQITEDLLGRKSVADVRLDFGQDPRNAPFFERFYAGGIDSLRGFEFRGVSPRSGLANDQIGGDFSLTGSVQYEFPLAEDFLRGVLFVDAGDVEPNFKFGVVRISAGFGFRLVLPFFGKAPLALDFGFPITQSPVDNDQLISFSFGISR